ncbi:MAG: SCP2 sterol-binding domain-containing protein [Bacteriovoracaceae bacterium]|nr:SCP2 sterol-binding domain-containing protein [Bacteriovoracaceae bacterium]
MKTMLLLITGALFSANIHAATLMSAEWAEEMCDLWNESEVLTTELDSFMENDLGRGYKAMLLKRKDCPDSQFVQVTVEAVDGLTTCTYGGEVTDEPDYEADYAMTAKTSNWLKLGSGDLSPAVAMMTFRLKFKGPQGEAMANMGPFTAFMRLIGETDYTTESCPE